MARQLDVAITRLLSSVLLLNNIDQISFFLREHLQGEYQVQAPQGHKQRPGENLISQLVPMGSTAADTKLPSIRLIIAMITSIRREIDLTSVHFGVAITFF